MVIIVVSLVVLICFIMYNMLIVRKNRVLRSKSNIDVYLMQRFDLIPNLVDCVKEYTNYERKILEDLVEIRAEYMKSKDIEIANNLNEKVNKIMIQVENYPDLKASEQYILLEKNLVKMENQLQAARRIYNLAVLKYNNLVTVFPINIMAKILKFGTVSFFEMNDEDEVSVKF